MKKIIVKLLILLLLLSPCFLFVKNVFGASNSWTFDNNSTEGFGANNSSLSATEGNLVQTITTDKNNTWLLSPSNLAIDTTVYKYLVIKVKNNTTQKGKFSFEGLDSSEKDFANVWYSLGDDIPNDNKYHEYRIDMSGISDWKGIVTRFRLRLSAWNCEGNVSVDYIKFESDVVIQTIPIKFISNAELISLTVYDGGVYTAAVINPEVDGTYRLSAGLYTYTAESASAKMHKNFTVTDSDIKAGVKNINIDLDYSWKLPGYWQVKTMYLPTDEVSSTHFCDPIPSLKVSTPSFVDGRDLNKFTTQTELETFINDARNSSSKMWNVNIGTTNNDLNIPLVIFSEGAINNANWSSVKEAADALHKLNKPIVWVGAQVHGNEIASGEGALELISELSSSWGDEVLKNVSVVILPRMNPKAAQYNRRTPNGDNDINRDRIKLELKETQIINQAYWLFVPEVAIDAHEYGAVPTVYKGKYTYPSYDILVSASTNFNVSSNIRSLSRSMYLNSIHSKLKQYGIRSMDYYDGGISSGIKEMSPIPNMNSNANALYPSFSFLVESLIPGGGYNSLYHFARRVKSHCLTAKTIIEITGANANYIKNIIHNERNVLLEQSKVYNEEDVVVLSQSTQEEIIDFEYIDLLTNKIETTVIKFNSYSKGSISKSVTRPLGYIVPKTEETKEAIIRLKNMGVSITELNSDEIPIGLQQYVVRNNNVSDKLKEGVYPNTLTVDIVDCENLSFENDLYYYISLEQLMTNFIALAMEPESETSFISYRVIDVESYKEGEILPYYRYVGIIEDEEPTIPDDNEDNNDNSGDSDNNSEIILPQNPVNPSLGCAGSVVVTFNSLVVLCALIIHIKKKRS